MHATIHTYTHIEICTYIYISVGCWLARGALPQAPGATPPPAEAAPLRPMPRESVFSLTQVQMHIALRPLCANHCGYFKTPMPNTYVEVLRLSLNEVMRFIANGAIANACGDDAGDNVCFCFPVFLPSSLFPLSTSVSSAARSTCFVESLSAFGRSEAP